LYEVTNNKEILFFFYIGMLFCNNNKKRTIFRSSFGIANITLITVMELFKLIVQYLRFYKKTIVAFRDEKNFNLEKKLIS